MTKKALITLVLTLFLSMLMILPVMAKKNAKIDRIVGSQANLVNGLSMQRSQQEHAKQLSSDRQAVREGFYSNGRRPLGSAAAPSAGTGPGFVIDNTFEDTQFLFPLGKHVRHSLDASNNVDVHFAYEDVDDSGADARSKQSGYQVYDASTGSWPLGLEQGCELQTLDTIGAGVWVNLDVMPNGLAVLGAADRFFADTLASGSFFFDHHVYYQDSRHDCLYTSGLNTTFVDTLSYQALFSDPASYSRDPLVVADEVGGTPVTHLLLTQNNDYLPPAGPGFVNGDPYNITTYWRKTGGDESGTWGNSQIIDTAWFVERNMAADPGSDRVGIVLTNSSVWGRLLNQSNDVDVFLRESLDGGLSWEDKENVTSFQNPVPGDPAHFKCQPEATLLYTSDGNLHIAFCAEPTSADPYNDGFFWQNWGANYYHWDRSSGNQVKVANGVFTDEDFLTSGINQFVCSFAPVNGSWISWISLSECDGNLYAVWNQFHERANRFDWMNDTTALNDCGYSGGRTTAALANAEILMSVSTTIAGQLWDAPRNLTDSYTPNCSYAGDPAYEGSEVCGNEFKPQVEPYALDESGLSVTWPATAEIDPGALVGEPAYTGDYYLNAQYVDDQYPGSWWRSDQAGNEFATLNSMKWLRIACVDPIAAPEINATPLSVDWPEWIKPNTSQNYTITVVNEGNVTLNVTSIGSSGTGVSSTAPGGFAITAGPTGTETFDVVLNSSGFSSPSWLDGTVTINSNDADEAATEINIHVLVADTVVAPVIDTVGTDGVFDASKAFASPTAGERIGLGVYTNSATASISSGVAGNGISMDYGLSGEECGTRARDSLYNAGGSPFTLIASESASVPSSVDLTTSFGHSSSASEHGWDPVVTPGFAVGAIPATGLAGDASYDSTYIGRSVNRDTTIAIEKTFYAPRTIPSAGDPGEWIVMKSVFYSADGNTHNHVSFGNATDWDVPADSIPDNISGASVSGNFVYQQGVDTTGHENPACLNSTRFAAEAMIWQYNTADSAGTATDLYWGAFAFDQLLIEDTNQDRSAAPIDPPQPDGKAWWEEINDNPGTSGNTTAADQAIWMSYQHDITIGPSDTFVVWSVYSTVRDGSLSDLEDNMDDARNWVLPSNGCCDGVRGDANCNGEIAVSDIGILVDHLFISGSALCCFEEADANGNGEIAVSDIGIIVEKLFIGGTEPPACP